MDHEELTEKIIGCAYGVYNRMGYGFLESVYEKCLLIELRKAGLRVESQRPIRVHYEGEVVGEFVADILVEDTVIVELKSVRKLAVAHEIQLVNYLVATGKPVGLILNFGERKVEVKRKVRDLSERYTGFEESCVSCDPVKKTRRQAHESELEGLAMTEHRDDGKLPPISGPGPEEGPEQPGAVPQVEGYEITGLLGEGGMGTVWRAVQLSTHRQVALKLLGRGAFGSEKDRARFEREVELTARLEHPNIGRIYDSGVHQGVHYYAMELIDGVRLGRVRRRAGLDAAAALRADTDGLPGSPACPRAGGDPPRPQVLEYPRDPGRPAARPRFWRCQGLSGKGYRPENIHRWRGPGHTALHVAGAGRRTSGPN